MNKYEIIWYDLEGEKARDVFMANSEEDALSKGYTKYNGNPPAKQHSIIRLD
jgi:hypothetical protein